MRTGCVLIADRKRCWTFILTWLLNLSTCCSHGDGTHLFIRMMQKLLSSLIGRQHSMDRENCLHSSYIGRIIDAYIVNRGRDVMESILNIVKNASYLFGVFLAAFVWRTLRIPAEDTA